MFQEEFNHIITDIAQLQDIDLADVRTIAERYPYCQLSQIIYAKKLHDQNSPNFEHQLKRASIAAYDREVLFAVIEHTSTPQTVSAGFEEEQLTPEVELNQHQIAVVNDDQADNALVTALIQSIPEIQTEDAVNSEVATPETSTPEIVDPQTALNEAVAVDEREEAVTGEKPEAIEQEFAEEQISVEEELMAELPELQMEEPLETEAEPVFGAEVEDPQVVVNDELQLDALLESSVTFDPVETLNEEATAILNTILEETPELTTEITLETEITSDLADDDLQTDPQMLVNEEEILDELEEMLLPESLPVDIVNPESVGLSSEETNGAIEIEDYTIEMPSVTMNEVVNQEVELSENLAELEEMVADFEDDDLVFDLPGYDIDKELGALSEEERINFPVNRPSVEEVPVESIQADSFTGWLNRLGGNHQVKVVEQKERNRPIRLNVVKEEQKPVAATTEMNEDIAAQLAKKSLQFDEQLTTETLARILVMQGKYQKAIDMYARLSLLKPQKSDYFAALIDQLKKRIK